MLLLTQGKEIPALKRALPIFEEVLAKQNLYLVPSSNVGQVPAQSQSQDNRMADADAELYENDLSFDMDFLGFDFLDEWQIGQLACTGEGNPSIP